jgi:hypothetical protein
MPPKRGPDPRVWFIRGSIGVLALAGLWLGLQTLFPVSESRINQVPTPIPPIDASAVGAPEPPVVQPTVQQPAATAVTQAAPAPEGDRLPGLPTPVTGAAAQAAPAAAAPAAAQPPAPAPQAAPPAAEPKPREESPSQQPVGKPTLEPIPPPESQANNPPAASPEQQAAQRAAQEAQRAAAAPKPQAPPPAAASTGGPFELAASASPVNPISEQAVVTISVRATQNGAPLAGASCMATIYYRTNTVKQPNGGFRTNASGVGSFTLDARGTTYGHYIPVDVTCSGRGGTATARTGFTPIKGR